jgi:hypothetical protein
MSRIRADKFVNNAATGAPQLSFGAEVVAGVGLTGAGGINITGVATAGSFVGNVTGNATGLSGTPNITVGNITGVAATFSGVLTYEDVTSVDSVGIVTARGGVELGAAGVGGTITATGQAQFAGVVTATSFSGSGANLTGVNPSVTGIASGALHNGATVVLFADGKVGIVTETGSSNPSKGSEATFESASTGVIAAAYVPDRSAVVVVYRDEGNSDYATYCVGTVDSSDNSITFGTPTSWYSAGVRNTRKGMAIAYDTNADRVIIFWSNASSSNELRYVVATVGTDRTLNLGSTSQLDSGNTEHIDCTFDSTNNKVIVCYQRASSGGRYAVGTVSTTDNTATFGSSTTFESGNVDFVAPVFHAAQGTVVITYADTSDSGKGKAVCGQVSGTTLSLGSIVEFNSGGNTQIIASAYDSANERIATFYKDQGNSDAATAIVGIVTTTAISFGSEVVWSSLELNYSTAHFNSSAGNVILGYKNATGGSTEYQKFTVSGMGVTTTGSAFELDSNYGNFIDSVYDSGNSRDVFFYRDNGNSNYGAAVAVQATSSSTNLTTENFLGFSDAAYTNGQTATIQVVGAVDDAQSGLTTARKHYVQSDGTLSLTADTPSVEAGIALSDTEILIR